MTEENVQEISNVTAKDIVKNKDFITGLEIKIKAALAATIREIINANVAHTLDKEKNIWIDMIRSPEDAMATYIFKEKLLSHVMGLTFIPRDFDKILEESFEENSEILEELSNR